MRATRDTAAIGYADGSYERIDLATGRRARLRPLAHPVLDLLGGDGRLWMAWDDQLACWELDGQLVTYATAPGATTNLFLAGERAVVIDTGAAEVEPVAGRPDPVRAASRRALDARPGRPAADWFESPRRVVRSA